MPPPGHEPFLHAICTNPEDDTVRLVYADWLDENGDPERAEFIRLQVAQADKPRAYDAAHFRAEALYKKNNAAWIGEIPQVGGIEWDDTFRRGFICGVRVIDSKRLLKHHTQLFAATPIQVLTLYDATYETAAKVFRIPEIDRLTELYLGRCRISPEHISVVTRCPRLQQLRTLGIRGRLLNGRQGLTDEEALELTETPCLTSLEEVYLDGWLTERAAQLLRSRYTTVRFMGVRR